MRVAGRGSWAHLVISLQLPRSLQHASVDCVWEHASVGCVWEHASDNCVWEHASVDCVWEQTSVDCVWEQASQMFGELCGVWMVDTWSRQGRVTNHSLCAGLSALSAAAVEDCGTGAWRGHFDDGRNPCCQALRRVLGQRGGNSTPALAAQPAAAALHRFCRFDVVVVADSFCRSFEADETAAAAALRAHVQRHGKTAYPSLAREVRELVPHRCSKHSLQLQ